MTDTRPPQGQQQPWQQQPYSGGFGYPSPAGMTGPNAQPYAGNGYYPGGGYGQAPFTPPQPEPKNGLAMPALVLGIITLALSPLPIINQAGILVGFVGVGLGIAALILGLKRGVRVVMSVFGVGLSILGLVASFAFTASFVDSLNNIGSSAGSSAPGTPAQTVGGDTSTTPEVAPIYTFKISGSAKSANVMWSVDGSSGSASSTKVPWTRTLSTQSNTSYHFATLSAYTDAGASGDLTCTVTDQTGQVIDTKTATNDGGEYGSASVNCAG